MTFGAVAYGTAPYAGPEAKAAVAGTFPTVAVEVAFESDPLAEAPVWTDVSVYLRSFDVNRGRQRELDAYQAGTASFVLANEDRRFDSEHGTNLLTPQEASMEDGITGWGRAVNCTLTRTTAQALDGVASLQMTSVTSSDISAETSRRSPVQPGRRYFAFASYRAATNARFCQTIIRFWDADGVETFAADTAELDTSTENNTTGWRQDESLTSEFAPEDAAFASVVVKVLSIGGDPGTQYVDAVAMYEDSTSSVYTSPPPYGAGRIQPGQRIRLRATYAGVTHPVFDGFIDSWDDVYEHPNKADVVVTATDGFKALNSAELPPSSYAAEVEKDRPAAWWRLDEPVDVTRSLDAIRGAEATLVGTTGKFGAGTLVARDGGRAFEAAGGTARLEVGDRQAMISGSTGFTIEVIFSGASGNVLYHQSDNSQTRFTSLRITSGGAIEFSVIDSATNHILLQGTNSTLQDGSPHHIVIVYDAAGTVRSYIDGVHNSGASTIAAVGLNMVADRSVLFGNGLLGTTAMTGVGDEVALYNNPLSATRVAAHASARAAPWNGDTPGVRIGRILDLVEWPSGLRSLDAGSSTLQSASLATSALDHAQKVRDSEFGELYITRAGVIRFEARTSLVNQPVGDTFGDTTGELGYVGIRFDHSDQLIRNDVTISRNDGAAQNARSEPSIKRFQRHSYTSDGLFHDDDELSRHAAQHIVAEYSHPLKRVASLTINPRANANTLFPAVLGRELTDWVTVKRRPQGVGDPITQIAVVEGISHSGTPNQWQTEWSLSPANTKAYWQLGVAGFSELSLSTRLFF